MKDSKTEPASEAKDCAFNIYLNEGINYTANTLGYADVEDLKQLASDSFYTGYNRAQEEITRLKAELEKKHNDLLDALDLKEGNGPTALSMLKAELEMERELRKDLVGYVVAYHGLSSLTSEEDIYIRSLIQEAKN